MILTHVKYMNTSTERCKSSIDGDCHQIFGGQSSSIKGFKIPLSNGIRDLILTALLIPPSKVYLTHPCYYANHLLCLRHCSICSNALGVPCKRNNMASCDSDQVWTENYKT